MQAFAPPTTTAMQRYAVKRKESPPDASVKTEPHLKQMCLNAGLIKAKEEVPDEAPPTAGAGPPAATAEQQAATADPSVATTADVTDKPPPAQTPVKAEPKGLFQKLTNQKASKLCITLSSPPPPSQNRAPDKDEVGNDSGLSKPSKVPPALGRDDNLLAATATSPEEQAEPAVPDFKKLLKSSAAKRIHNAFVVQQKCTPKNAPELQQHYEDLMAAHPSGSAPIVEFKKAISECKRGNFDTPAVKSIKRRIRTKEWGKKEELASWKQVVDKHGSNVAYAALRQGTLPYVPHTLLLPGHGVKWPESHEFIMSRTYWTSSWKDELAIVADDEDMPSDETIDKFISEAGYDTGIARLKTRDAVLAGALTGIPKDIGEQAETATPEVRTEAMRSIHPEHSGNKYDEVHNTVMKNIAKCMSEWPRFKSKHEVSIAKAGGNPLAKPVCDRTNALLAQADTDYKHVTDQFTTISVKGKGFLSKQELETVLDKIETIFKHNKEIQDCTKALCALMVCVQPSRG